MAGLVEVESSDTNQKYYMRNTPLGWAAVNGHEEVVKMLLERDDIDPNLPDRCDHTPLL